MRDETPQLFWRSRHNNVVNHFYYAESDGCYKLADFKAFWYGIHEFDEIIRVRRLLPQQGADAERPRGRCGRRRGSVMTGGQKKTIGIVGARGHTGVELIRLIAAHPCLELAFVSSRELAGKRVSEQVAEFTRRSVLRGTRCRRGRREARRHRDPRAAERQGGAVRRGDRRRETRHAACRLSARTTVSTSAWYYGLPELFRKQYRGQRRISNPGCYATAMQLAIAPLREAARGAAGLFRRVGLFRRGHDAVGPQRSGKAARQPDAVLRWSATRTSAR